jgi:hypothetical protein
LLAGAERAGVDLVAKDLQWPTPTTVEDTQSVLIALDLMDDAFARAFAASMAVRDLDPDAFGLVSIDELKVEGDKKAGRSRKKSEAQDRIKEYRVTFKLRADAPTVIKMLESFKKGPRPINLGATPPFVVRADTKRPGDPLTVSGVLVAMQVEPQKGDA